jgi:hypothetical protein
MARDVSNQDSDPLSISGQCGGDIDLAARVGGVDSSIEVVSFLEVEVDDVVTPSGPVEKDGVTVNLDLANPQSPMGRSNQLENANKVGDLFAADARWQLSFFGNVRQNQSSFDISDVGFSVPWGRSRRCIMGHYSMQINGQRSASN